MEIYIYDLSGNRVGILSNYRSIQWIEFYNETGEFWITVDDSPENSINLKVGNRLHMKDDGTIGFVEYVYYHEGSIELRGHLDNLCDRINYGTCHIKNVESDIYKLISANIRGLDICLSEAQSFLDTVPQTETTYKTLRDTVSEICKQCGLGYRMIKKEKALNTFELYSCRKNSDVIFSEDYNNIVSQYYSEDISNYKNFAIVAGEGEGADRKIVYVDETKGDRRRELFVDARDITRRFMLDGIEHNYSEKEYEDVLKQRGMEKLSALALQKDYRVDVDITNQSFRFGVDYFLGDVVRVKSIRFETVTWMRILSVKRIFEESYKLVLTLSTEGVDQ